MITGDLDRLLAGRISQLATAADGITSAGTWSPVPPGGAQASDGVQASGGVTEPAGVAEMGSGAAPGVYATPVAFRLAGERGWDAPRIAGMLADAARAAGWVAAADVTGGGYLTVAVTADALAALAVRITQAGAACARSTALAGTAVPALPEPGLASAGDWPDARRRLQASISARLAEAAGARIIPSFPAERSPATPSTPGTSPGSARKKVPGSGGGAAPGSVAGAVAFAGAWAIGYALARLPPGAPARVDPWLAAAHHLGNPAYAVRYAHAHAASILRQAADLGLGLGEAAAVRPQLLAHPSERRLLDQLSWLPERVAGAARRARPDVLTGYTERLAGAYFDCQEACPAIRPGHPATRPGHPAGGQETVARLWLAAAARTALHAGLGLLGVDAPDRL